MRYALKARVYTIPSSALWILLIIGCFLALCNWVLFKPRSDGKPPRLPRFLRRAPPYNPKIFEYNDVTIQQLTESRMEWSGGCPKDCGARYGWGFCDEVRCICHDGHGGSDCGIGLDAFYGTRNMYQNLTLRPLDLSGWDLGGDLYAFLVQRVQPSLVVEIGVWKGASAMKLAKALKEQGSGVLLAVDTWLPLWGTGNDHVLPMYLPDTNFESFPIVFRTFLSNVMQLNLTDYVIPLPATSRTAAAMIRTRQQKAELVHIDGAHGYEDVSEDIRVWWRNLRDGGILMGDDWSTAWPGVLKAVREHGSRYCLDIHVYGNKWWIYKPMKP